MPVPNTTGQLKSSIRDMGIGDYICCNYKSTSNAVGVFSNLGGVAGAEIAVAGTIAPNGSFYFIKVDRGLLIADRVIQHSIRWDTLNAGMLIQGSISDIGNTIPTMTSNNAPSGLVSASTVSGVYDAFKAMDGLRYGQSPSGYWMTNGNTGWLQYQSSSPKSISAYLVSVINDPLGVTRAPVDWTLLGSINGTDWEEVDKQINASWAVNERKVFGIKATKPFSYFRLDVTKNGGATAVAVDEFGLFETEGNRIRSLTGGVAYADANGNSIFARPTSYMGAWTVNNEYDTYIKNSDLQGKVSLDDDSVWHHKSIYTWVQETPAVGLNIGGTLAANTSRMVRGNDTNANPALRGMSFGASSSAGVSIGFRPVFEYKEV